MRQNLISGGHTTGCITQYGYSNHLITSITDPEGCEATYKYDSSNRALTRSVAGNLGQYTYQTDGDGNLVTTAPNPLLAPCKFVTSPTGNPVRHTDPLGNVWTTSYLTYRPR